MEHDGLGRPEVLERFDGGHHFHAIIGRVRTMSRALLSFLAILNDDVGPAAWTRVPKTATVGINLDRRDELTVILFCRLHTSKNPKHLLLTYKAHALFSPSAWIACLQRIAIDVQHFLRHERGMTDAPGHSNACHTTPQSKSRDRAKSRSASLHLFIWLRPRDKQRNRMWNIVERESSESCRANLNRVVGSRPRTGPIDPADPARESLPMPVPDYERN